MRFRLSLKGLTAPAAVVVLVVLLAGCGGGSSSSSSGSSDNGVSSKSPADILTATKVVANGANSVHVAGSIVSDGSPITLDMNLLAGKGGRGKLSESGLAFELIAVGKTVYIKGSPAFYKHIGGSAAAQLFQGKWLKASATDSDFASLSQLYPGRIFLGLGSGEALNEKAATGNWPKWQERWDRLIEAIDIIRALWTGNPVQHTANTTVWPI